MKLFVGREVEGVKRISGEGEVVLYGGVVIGNVLLILWGFC